MQTQVSQEDQTDIELELNANRMSPNDLMSLAHILLDIDAIHQAGHMDPATFGAIVNLVARTMLKEGGWYQCFTKCPLNAH